MAILPLTKNEMYPAHFLAKKLNNKGSNLLTRGEYNEGIIILTKALKIAERDLCSSETIINNDGNKNNTVPCSCKFCSLDTVLSVGNRESSISTLTTTNEMMVVTDDEEDESRRRRNNNSRTKNDFNSAAAANTTITTTTDNEDINPYSYHHSTHHHRHQKQDNTDDESSEKNDDDDGFVYQCFQFVNNHSIEEHHDMGMTLPFIIILNLALAYHSKAIKEDDDESSLLTGFQQAMKLYELAYQLHADLVSPNNDPNPNQFINNQQRLTSLRLTIIISNNLSEIHRLAGNPMKHRMCLEHLLSVIMYMVHDRIVFDVLDRIEFDGILRNVSSIVLENICATAA